MSAPALSPPKAALILAFALIYVIWGSTYLGIRFAIDSMPPLLMAGMRHTLAGLVLYAIMRWRGEAAPTANGWSTAFIIGVCLLTFGNGGVTLGEQYLPSS
ncbi:MAG TPA: EamA family transporter, partial [Hymenobacter sp.]